MSRIIGIDLGTTYSTVACLDKGKAFIIPSADGKRTTPSIVALLEDGMIAGEEARRYELSDPSSIIRRIKRKMGSDYRFTIHNKSYSPEEISAAILKILKEQAENYFGERITDAVITVPAYFNDNQRQATKNAGKLAGLNVIRIINEPTAAALAYGIQPEEDLSILVYDLGGGTFDVSILSLADGIFEVVATAGDNNLGGEDFNQRIIETIVSKFKEETRIDLSTDPFALSRLYNEVEKAKINLSEVSSARILIPLITADENGPRNIDFTLTRSDFEQMISDYIDRTMELCLQSISDCNLKPKDINRVILIGGSSRIPYVNKKLAGLFKVEINTSMNPEETVACGAAIQGGIAKGDVNGMILVDVNPISLGIAVEDKYFVPVIERNSPIPTCAKRTFTTVVDNQKSVDVHVMQGESMHIGNNVSLGKFRLEGIRKAISGEPRIEVTFEVDANGILHVSAQDVDTQSVQGITIVEQSRLSEQELSRIQAEYSKRYQDEIQKRTSFHSVLRLKTKADTIIKRIQKSLPHGIDSGIIQDEIHQIISHINTAVSSINPVEIEKFVSRLEFILSELNAHKFAREVSIA